jgi:hypothetical protein
MQGIKCIVAFLVDTGARNPVLYSDIKEIYITIH